MFKKGPLTLQTTFGGQLGLSLGASPDSTLFKASGLQPRGTMAQVPCCVLEHGPSDSNFMANVVGAVAGNNSDGQCSGRYGRGEIHSG